MLTACRMRCQPLPPRSHPEFPVLIYISRYIVCASEAELTPENQDVYM